MKLRLLALALVVLAGLMPRLASAQSLAPVVLPGGCGTANYYANTGYLTIDTTGKLCTSGSGGGGGGLSVTDQAAFTQGSSSFTPGGGVFNDAATLSSGQQGMFRMTTKRAQIVDVDTTGNALYSALNLGVGPVSPGVAAPNSIMMGGVYNSANTAPTNGQQQALLVDAWGNLRVGQYVSPGLTNPTSTLTLTSTTTAYTANQLIASSATAGSIVVPSFAIANTAGGVYIPRLRLSTNDATSTAWGGQTIQVDLWSAAPTWTNGDRGAWSPATGTGSHLATYSCVMSAEYGDGAYAECGVSPGNLASVRLASGTSVFWSLKATTGSGVTGASKVFTLTAELSN